MRQLDGTEWHWAESQEKSFTALKTLATQAPVLKYFDASQPVKISVDASSQGIGAVLLQDDQTVASKALSQSQQNYEKEMLVIVFGCTRFHQYIYELKEVQVETDHKPLEYILKEPLHQEASKDDFANTKVYIDSDIQTKNCLSQTHYQEHIFVRKTQTTRK